MSAVRGPRHRATLRRSLSRTAMVATVVGVVSVLLVGGHGTLSAWRASGTDPAPGSFTTGTLSLAPATSNGVAGCSGWAFARTGGTLSGAPTTTAYTDQVLQPHDRLTRDCRYTLTAQGQHLVGTIAVTGVPASLPADVVISTTTTVGGAAGSGFTAADDGESVVVTFTLDVTDATTPDSSQTLPVAVSGISVVATQGRPS